MTCAPPTNINLRWIVSVARGRPERISDAREPNRALSSRFAVTARHAPCSTKPFSTLGFGPQLQPRRVIEMENIFRLVNESLARHNFNITGFDDQPTNSEGAPSLSSSARQGGDFDFLCGTDTLVRDDSRGLATTEDQALNTEPTRVSAPHQSLPSTSSAWGVRSMEANTMQAPIREAKDASRRPTPLPSGF